MAPAGRQESQEQRGAGVEYSSSALLGSIFSCSLTKRKSAEEMLLGKLIWDAVDEDDIVRGQRGANKTSSVIPYNSFLLFLPIDTNKKHL
jgi:hypothetical protein